MVACNMFVSLIISARRVITLAIFISLASLGSAEGIHVWRKNASTLAMSNVAALGVDSHGNSYVAGGRLQAYGVVTCLSPSGAINWTRDMPEVPEISDMVVDSDGDCFVAGTDAARHIVAKLDPNGNLLWTNFGLPGNSGSASRITLRSAGRTAIVEEHLIGGMPHYGYDFINADGSDGGVVDEPAFGYVNAIAFDNSDTFFYGGGAGAAGLFLRVAGASSQQSPFASSVIAVAPDGVGACFAVSQGIPNSQIAKFADGGPIWTTTAAQNIFMDVAVSPDGKAIVASQAGATSAMYKYKQDGTLESSASFAGLLGNYRVLCNGVGDCFVLSETQPEGVAVHYIRKLSGSDFAPMWSGTDIGNSIKLTYDDSAPKLFVMNSDGDIFSAGKGPNGEMFVDKIIEQPSPEFTNFTITPNPVRGSRNATGTVTVSAPVASDTQISLDSSNMSFASVSPSATIHTGQTSATFTIATSDPHTAFVDVVITAKIFGQSKSVTLRVLQANSSKYVSCSLPATVTGGHSYSVKVKFWNTGTLPWDSVHFYQLRSEDPANNLRWHVNRMQLVGGPVAPGELATFSAVVRAPLVAGTYSFRWRPIAGSAGGVFGTTGGPTAVHVTSPLHPTTPPVSTRRRHRRR